MKKTLSVILAALAFGSLAQAETTLTTTTVTLPDSVQLTGSRGWVGGNGATVVENYVGEAYGLYCGSNGGNVELETGEGNWTNTDGVGTMTTFGRGGASGESFAMVLGSEIAAGTQIQSLTFTGVVTPPSNMTGGARNFTFSIGLRDTSAGTTFKADNVTVSAAAGATEAFSVTYTFDTPFVWEEGDKIVAGVGGPGFAPNTGALCTYGNIAVTAEVVTEVKPQDPTPAIPEPATATLSLLALAGLAARRRRK